MAKKYLKRHCDVCPDFLPKLMWIHQQQQVYWLIENIIRTWGKSGRYWHGYCDGENPTWLSVFITLIHNNNNFCPAVQGLMHLLCAWHYR